MAKKPKIAAAAGSASGTLNSDKTLSNAVERAMQQAVIDCMKEGITDPEKQREAMMAARGKVRSAGAA